MTLSRVSRAALLGGAVALAGCEQGELLRPSLPAYSGAARFYRYVALGNSITAGFQSGGISRTTQTVAYPSVVAAQMGGSPFHVPELAAPGCPVPYSNIFTQTKVVVIPGDCAFRVPGTPPPYLSNVAVPGAAVLDILHNYPDTGLRSNALTMLLLGGRTQFEAMTAARPTFVSVWIGNNNVLGAALSGGDTLLIKSTTEFQAAYTEALDAIAAAGAEAILIGVANVIAPADRAGLPPTQPPANGVPFFSYGSTYYALDQAGFIPGTFTADPTCAPPRGDSVLVPFPVGGTLIAGGGTLTCNEPETVQPAEVAKFVATVAAYNTFILGQATTRGWAYLNPNQTLDSLRRLPTQVAYFPAFGAPCSQTPFGQAFSCDAIHPSTATHRLIARKVVQEINAEYGSAIPAVP